LIDRANQFYEEGRYEETIESIDHFIELKPRSDKAWDTRGRVLCEMKKYKEALESFDKVVELQPTSSNAWDTRGRLLGFMKRYKEALESFDKAVELQPTSSDAWSNRGSILCQVERYAEALESFDKAIELGLISYDAWSNRGGILLQVERYAEALESCDKAIELDPTSYNAWSNRGSILHQVERYAEALESFDKAIELDPISYDAWSGRGDALWGMEKYEDALDSYNASLDLNQDSYQSLSGRGSVLNFMGKHEEAIVSIERALELEPRFYQGWNGRSNVLHKMGRYREALESAEKSIEIKPKYFHAWHGRGNAFRSMNMYKEALESYGKSIELNPYSWLYRKSYADTILILHGYKDQVAAYKAAIDYMKSNSYLVGSGFLYHQVGLAHYHEGRQQLRPYSYASKAISRYHTALQTLTAEAFPQDRLPVLIDLAKAHILRRDIENTNDITTAHRYQTEALALWCKILSQQTHPGAVKRLYSQYSYLLRTQVDVAILAHDPQTAIAIAELHKNHYLKWFLLAQAQPDQTTHLILDQLEQLQQQTLSLKYETMRQLLAPQRGILYWHLSNDTLTTFILHPQRLDPIVLATSASPCFDWLQAYDPQDLSTADWPQLKEILQVSAIDPHLTGLTDLILIPHRDLHRLPLHSYWPTLNTTYLPSIQTGLTLQSKSSGRNKLVPENHLLLFKLPTYHNYSAADDASDSSRNTKSNQTSKPLTNAEIELAILAHQWQCNLMPQGESAKVTCDALTNSLAQPYRYAHFSGHAYHDANQPSDSYLTLDDGQKFVCTDFQKLNLDNYDLISLSACETGITRSTIEQDYVGLVSACLSRGTSYVLSTLWPIADLPSSLFMLFFYDQIQKGTAPPIALRQTAQWLRQLTPSDIAEYYGDLAQRLPIGSIRARVESLQRRGIPSDLDLPFQDPQYGAAFTLSGVAAADL
jgi:tetratricopeptide (TPR) repeat protein/CHAT domain-containing protein